jgi:sugar-phosphatase
MWECALALRRIEAAGLPVTRVLVTAEDGSRGKPAPDCFTLAAKRLGVTPDRCLVFHAPAGIAPARAAGCDVAVITATHAHDAAFSRSTQRDFTRLSVGKDAAGPVRVNFAGA